LSCFHEVIQFPANIPAHSVAAIAVSVLVDFSIAFASVSHDWLFRVLKAIDAPQGFISAVHNRYRNYKAYLLQEGAIHYMFEVKGGVMQSCPLSVVLFLLAIDLCLWLLGNAVFSVFGHFFAAPDDIAIALDRLDSLPLVERAFTIFGKLSGLTLQPAQCFMILGSVVANAHNKYFVEQWLESYLPAYKEFVVGNHGLYLWLSVWAAGRCDSLGCTNAEIPNENC